MLTGLTLLIGGAVMSAFLGWLGRRRRRAATATGVLDCRAHLLRDGQRAQRGRLMHADGATAWTSRRRDVVDLTGLQVQRVAPVAANGRAQVLLTGLVGAEVVRLRLDGQAAAALVELLRGASARRGAGRSGAAGTPSDDPPGQANAGELHALPVAPPEPPQRGPRWSWRFGIVLIVLGMGWLISWNWLTVVGGDRVTATVVSNDGENYCQVTWQLDAKEHAAGIDCGSEQAGETVQAWAVAAPFRGEAVDRAFTPWFFAFTGIGAVVLGAWLVRPRAPAPELRTSAVPDGLPGHVPGAPFVLLPDRSAGALEDAITAPAASVRELLQRLHPYAVTQADPSWESPKRPDGARAPRAWVSSLKVVAAALAALGVLLFFALPGPYRAYVLATTNTATTTAVATDDVAVEGADPFPAEQTVRLTLPGGKTQRADVSTTRTLRAGEEVEVDYAIDRPGWARLTGPADGQLRVLSFFGGGLLLILSGAIAGFVNIGLRSRALREANAGRRRPALTILTGDIDTEAPSVLIADEAITPPRLLVAPLLTPLPAGTVQLFATGPVRVDVIGALQEGKAVVLLLPDGQLLQPAGLAWQPDTDDLTWLLDSAGALAAQ